MAIIVPAPVEKEETTAEYIRRVRSTTCYSALRSVVNVTYGLLIVAVLVAALSLYLNQPYTRFYEMRGFLPGLALGTIVSVILIVSARQASILLVDIADTLIDSGRRKKRPNQSPQRNAGSRPTPDDSPVSETPSSLGPRG